jgi:hypothetical protein
VTTHLNDLDILHAANDDTTDRLCSKYRWLNARSPRSNSGGLFYFTAT